jgi:hypothetical protein
MDLEFYGREVLVLKKNHRSSIIIAHRTHPTKVLTLLDNISIKSIPAYENRKFYLYRKV